MIKASIEELKNAGKELISEDLCQTGEVLVQQLLKDGRAVTASLITQSRSELIDLVNHTDQCVAMRITQFHRELRKTLLLGSLCLAMLGGCGALVYRVLLC